MKRGVSLRLELEPDEEVLRRALARALRPIRPGWKLMTYADGWLYLTTARVMWRRGWFTTPIVSPRSVDITLNELRRCEVRGSALLVLLAGGGGLVLTTDAQEFRFLVAKHRLWPPALWFSKKTAEEWCEAINSAKAW